MIQTKTKISIISILLPLSLHFPSQFPSKGYIIESTLIEFIVLAALCEAQLLIFVASLFNLN